VAMKKLIFAAVVIGLIAGGLQVASMLGEAEFETLSQTVFESLDQANQDRAVGSYSSSDFDGLPKVVKAYLKKALPQSGSGCKIISLTQSGETRLSEDDSWNRFTARQMIAHHSPAMVYVSKVDYLPLSPVHILITLGDEQTKLESYLWGLSQIFSNQGMGFKRYLMQRWLAETVWHPDALLPGGKVQWHEAKDPIPGARAARVSLEYGGLKVSGQFIFTSLGGPPMMFLSDPERSGQFTGQRWYCSYSDWQRHGELQIPFELVQGVRNGISDDMRLRIKLKSIQHQR
jgi:hypothetical protein